VSEFSVAFDEAGFSFIASVVKVHSKVVFDSLDSCQHKCKYEQRKQEVDHLPIHQFFDSTKPFMPCFATVRFNRNQSRDHLGGPRSGGRTNVWISPLHSFREFSIFSPNAGWKRGADGAETSELVKKIMFYPTER
jgi:hypothetical protein